MALLTLKDIGKIYASANSVAVGIRGVNLSFDKGEFVAITGKSGSGKSTLLNVISGMDTYEEGEMYIEGNSTSHYLQPDWEEYRQKYISFIFQDYNIIESFTVLQNVELALMHIEDGKERRAKALELLRRVGLGDRLKQKGSKLSGGQKQRTVIARALAKDSPIILADEPTGNLDSKTSEEIIELLREVSKDKLLIVVTHNFEQVQKYATRQIRIFDGAVEYDHAEAVRSDDEDMPSDGETRATAAESVPQNENVDIQKDGEASRVPDSAVSTAAVKEQKTRPRQIAAELKKGFALGSVIFRSTPKLTVFLCMLLIVGAFAIFLVTSVCGGAVNLFRDDYMFNHIKGRVVVTHKTGGTMLEEDVARLAAEYGAKDHLACDLALDSGYFESYVYQAKANIQFKCAYKKDYGKNIIGRYPVEKNEVFLYIPISLKPYFGDAALKIDKIALNELVVNVTGVKYYYDNTKTPEILFSDAGLRVATAFDLFARYINRDSAIFINDNRMESFFWRLYPSFDLPTGKAHIDISSYTSSVKPGDNTVLALYFSYVVSQDGESIVYEGARSYGNDDITNVRPSEYTILQKVREMSGMTDGVYIAVDDMCDIAEDIISASYRQASLFFESDKRAREVAKELNKGDYIAVSSDTTFDPPAMEVIERTVLNVLMLFVWLIAIIFLAFFINICTRRTMDAFKGDMAIMRSMGIPVKTVKISIYVRMLLSLLPTFVFIAVAATVIFLTPVLNKLFVFLHAWQYVLIFFGMVLLTLRVTRLQIKRLFDKSVKKSLKGGAE